MFGQSREVQDIIKFFEYEHLPPHLQEVSEPFCRLAKEMAYALSGPEMLMCLRKLLESKDCAVRAAIVDEPSSGLTRQDVPAP